MNPTPEMAGKIEAYLRAVEKNIAHKSAAVRKELLDELREHIAESLRHGGGDIDRVLAEMDPPESFADATPPPSAETAREETPRTNGGGKWFLLALAFLAVNS